MTAETTYIPTATYDPHPESAYTWDELVALHRHWGGDGNIREMADGRVVDTAGELIARAEVA